MTSGTTFAGPIRQLAASVLRPLVRFLISKGVTLPWLVEEVKQAYVAEAVAEVEASGKVTTSRITLMTGIHRNEVKRLMQTDERKEPKSIHPVSAMIAYWQGELCDELGKPIPLGRAAPADGVAQSFFDVADHATNRDVAPATFLTQCLHQNIVRHDPETDMVYLEEHALVPPAAFDEKAHFFSRNEGDHLAAGFANLNAEKAPFFDRSVMYESLSDQDVKELDALARDLAMDAILEVNREARKRSNVGHQGRWRLNFGSFIFFEKEDK